MTRKERSLLRADLVSAQLPQPSGSLGRSGAAPHNPTPKGPRPVASAYRRYLRARDDLSRSGRDHIAAPPGDLWRPVLAAMEEVLAAYAAGDGAEAFPREVAHSLARLLADPASGRPSPVLDAVNVPFKVERRDMLCARMEAVRFIRAVDAGQVRLQPAKSAWRETQARGPVALVARAYGVPRQTVQRWLKELPEAEPYAPPFGIQHPMEAQEERDELARALVEIEAQRYRAASTLSKRIRAAPRR